MKRIIKIFIYSTFVFFGTTFLVRSVSALYFTTQGGDVHVGGDQFNPNINTAPPEPFFSQTINSPRIESGIVTYIDNSPPIRVGRGSQDYPGGSNPAWVRRVNPDTTKPILSKYNYGYYYNFLSSDYAHPGTYTCSAAITGIQDGWVIFINGNLNINPGCTVDNYSLKNIFVVNGNLDIRRNITLDPNNGFLAFIVNGNIRVHTTLGQVDRIEGLYLSNGMFCTTGNPASCGNTNTGNQFVGKGIFTSHNRILLGKNVSNPTEHFIYDPELLFKAPVELREESVSEWEEVAP